MRNQLQSFMVIKLLSVLTVVFLVAGCAPYGIIYSDTVSPYSRNFSLTSAGSKKCEIKTHQLREPFSGYNISSEWTTGYILNEARNAGIKEISYIDKQTISILLGIYKREKLIVYGD